MSRLFDMDLYGGEDAPPVPKSKPEPPTAVELGVGRWGLITVNKHPEAHILMNDAERKEYRRQARVTIVNDVAVTLCRIVGTPLTYEPGIKAGGCAECIARNGGHP